jgi:hypothetical protein
MKLCSPLAHLLLCPAVSHAGVPCSRRHSGCGVSSGIRGDAQCAHAVQEDQVKKMPHSTAALILLLNVAHEAHCRI